MTKAKLYGIYSSRGIWVELVKNARTSTKRVSLYGKAEAEKKAEELALEHKRAYWVQETLVTPVAE